MKRFFISLVIFFQFCNVFAGEMSWDRGNGTFLYFAYGSNLLKQRLHINNPSAVRYAHAKLENYRLDFAGFSKRWGGAVATIEPDQNAEMWGAVWQMDNSHKDTLDEQEGVHNGVYSPLSVTVLTEDGRALQCRSYRYNVHEPLTGGTYNNLPENRRPSPLYLETILRGAKESSLPENYYNLLASIPSNTYKANVTLDEFLARSALVNQSRVTSSASYVSLTLSFTIMTLAVFILN